MTNYDFTAYDEGLTDELLTEAHMIKDGKMSIDDFIEKLENDKILIKRAREYYAKEARERG